MIPKTEELYKRTFEFGLNCPLSLKSLLKSKVNAVITYQLVEATTSVGSNYGKAQAAESGKDFVHKIGVVLKETRESNYRLRFLDAILTDNSKNEKFRNNLSESIEFKKMSISIKLTAQQNLYNKIL